MSYVNDSPNHFVIRYVISRGMRSVGKIVKVTRLDKAIVEIVSQRLAVIADKKGLPFRRQEGEKQ
ncbi:MAG: hypothetical protein WA220_00435 [Candidatus Nitrosopolaris sp.]